jgi:glycosyltransferase involved in cell wall biosynthesis
MTKEQHKISGVMVVTNEAKFLQESITNIYPHVDELIILNNNSTDDSVDIIKAHTDFDNKIRLVNIPFFEKMNFTIGGIKNFACELTQYWWTLLLDPDETIEDKFYDRIHWWIDNERFDAVALPRKNFIDGELTSIYPDWQLRFRRSFCRYVYGVHHELVGYQRLMQMPMINEEDGYHIIHNKTTTRQLKQNDLYDRLYRKYNHFCRQRDELYAQEHVE